MKVVITEKPDIARKFAKFEIFGKQKHKNNGYIETNQGVILTWAFGHLFEQAPPDEYVNAPVDDNGRKPWRKEDLPIIPTKWKLLPRKTAKAQIAVIAKLLKTADEVIHVGDADREGQLLIDEIIEELRYTGPVYRVWLKAMTKEGMAEAVAQMKSNKAYENLKKAALARSRADWLIGMNATRAMTLSQKSGVLSVGRVQTPTLRLIVDRDLEIENFKPVDYYEILAKLQTDAGEGFKARYAPPESYLSNGYLLDEALAQNVLKQVQSLNHMTVTKVEKKKMTQHPPLPFSLSDLQSTLAKYGISADQALSIAQGLYEKGYTTYPRTDCGFLEESAHKEAPRILTKLQEVLPQAAEADPSIKSPAFNDKKVGAHTGIAPTGEIPKDLTDLENKVYMEVVRRYVAQFFPPMRYEQTSVKLEAGEHLFTASGRIILDEGWRRVYSHEDKKDAENDETSRLPDLQEGQSVQINDVAVEKKQTKPPSRFKHARMPSVMKNIARFVKTDDPNIKALLKNSKGIGTEATRAQIIKTLVERGYVEVKGRSKELISTEKGRMLIKIVPVSLKDLVTTAIWEQGLSAIEAGKLSLEEFEEAQKEMTKEIVREILSQEQVIVSDDAGGEKQILGKCPLCGGDVIENAKAYGCSNWPKDKGGCRFTIWKTISGARITRQIASQLLDKGVSRAIKFKSKQGKPFEARLKLEEDGKVSFLFDNNK